MSTLLLTGGTGSFGQSFVRAAQTGNWFDRIIIFSDTESNQSRMKQDFPPSDRLDYFIGNVRDYARLREAMRAGVDIVVHAAAMKEVPTCEYDWPEAFETNVMGSRNVALAAINAGVKVALLISSDKATAATTGYGKTKGIAEEWFIRSNRGFGKRHMTILGAVRYGNVLGSRASVVPLFRAKRESGDALPITDLAMTRFWWPMASAVSFVHLVLNEVSAGEIWVPKLRAASMLAMAQALADDSLPTSALDIVGVRGREKLHEMMIDEDEARHTVDTGYAYVILPAGATWPVVAPRSLPVPGGFTYRSDHPTLQMSIDELRGLL